MELIKEEDSFKCSNSENCKNTEYSFNDKDLDLGLAEITGRYPKKGYCLNEISKELIYILEGSGILYFKNSKIKFKKGDSILINNNEKYYWECDYCKIAMFCAPAFKKEQYKIVD